MQIRLAESFETALGLTDGLASISYMDGDGEEIRQEHLYTLLEQSCEQEVVHWAFDLTTEDILALEENPKKFLKKKKTKMKN